MFVSLGLWLFSTLPIASRAFGAERIYVVYGLLKFSLPVKSLEIYAKEGKIDDYFADYAKYIPPQQLKQLPKILTTPLKFSPVAVSQSLYSIQGEILLAHMAQVIQSESGLSGFFAIRSALILAAGDPEGLTLLNVLQKFPTHGLRIDVERGFQITEELKRLVEQTQAANIAIEQQSAAEIAEEHPSTLSKLPDLRMKGAFDWQKKIINVSYERKGRQRAFAADIYLPLPPLAQSQQLSLHGSPVIVISHGLNSNRTTLEYLAKHLASYGFAIAVPEHPGITDKDFRALLEGKAEQFLNPSEFINTSLDVKYLLDELERHSKTDPLYKQLNLQQVGAIGQSFGGYTALALAGAKINFRQLQKDCKLQSNSTNFLNLSLDIQCTLLQLPTSEWNLPNLRDERVKAVIALNPTAGSVLGQAGFSQIKVPVMIVAGSSDIVGPALLEAIRPFTWLTAPDKYLVLLKGATHFSTLDESALGENGIFAATKTSGIEQLHPRLPGADVIPSHSYMSALSLAFLQTYIANQPEYRPYLSASYAKVISQDPFSLYLVRSLHN